jgi:hypothetical protein
MTWEGIVENLISSFLFLFLSLVIAWFSLNLSERKRLLGFFCANRNRRLVVYLSNLRVRPSGAVGIDGAPRSYQGSAVTFGEMVTANRFRDLFNYIVPSLSDAGGGILSKLLISDVRVQKLQSPLNKSQLEQSASFITLGSPAYNVASKYVEENLHSKARFRLGETRLPSTGLDSPSRAPDTGISLSPSPSTLYSGGTADLFRPRAPDTGISLSPSPPTLSSGDSGSANIFRPMRTAPTRESEQPTDEGVQPSAILVDGIPPITDSNYGFVERVIDQDAKRSIFYVAGISELATVGAANYLISEWDTLNRKYGAETRFLVMLRLEPPDSTHWSIVFER